MQLYNLGLGAGTNVNDWGRGGRKLEEGKKNVDLLSAKNIPKNT